MNPEQMQGTTEMTPDEARASLGIATRLSEGVFNPKKAPESPENVPEQEETPEQGKGDIDGMKDELMKEVKALVDNY
jgi:hypothetical protein